MTHLTEYISELREKANAATEGPWEASEFGTGGDEPSTIIVHQGAFDWGAIRDGVYVVATPVWDEPEYRDAEFIAASRTAVPALLDAVEKVLALCETPPATIGARSDGLVYVSDIRAALNEALGVDE